jgi:lambda family phage tail tape measure protein
MADLAELGIAIRSDGVVVAVDRLKQLEQEAGKAESATDKLGKSFDSLQSIALKLAGYFATFELGKLAKDATMAAAHHETLALSMRKVGENAGYTIDQLEHLTETLTKYGMTEEGAMEVINKMAGQYLNLADAQELAERARDIGIAKGEQTTEVMSAMIRAIETGNTRMLRQFDIMVNQETAVLKYADSLHLSTKELNENQRMEAIRLEVMRKSAGYAGVAASTQDMLTRKLGALRRAWDEFHDDLGKAFQGPGAAVLSALTDQLEHLRKIVQTDEFQDKLKRVAEAAAKLAKVLVEMGAQVGTLAYNLLDVLANLPEWVLEAGIIGVFLFGKKAKFVIAGIAVAASVIKGVEARGRKAADEETEAMGYGAAPGAASTATDLDKAKAAAANAARQAESVKAAAEGAANRKKELSEEEALRQRKLAAELLASEKAAGEAQWAARISLYTDQGKKVEAAEAELQAKLYSIEMDRRVKQANMDAASGTRGNINDAATAAAEQATIEGMRKIAQAKAEVVAIQHELQSKLGTAMGSAGTLGSSISAAFDEYQKGANSTTTDANKEMFQKIFVEQRARLSEDAAQAAATAQNAAQQTTASLRGEGASSLFGFDVEARQAAKVAQVQAEEAGKMLAVQKQITDAVREEAAAREQLKSAKEEGDWSEASLAALQEEIDRRKELVRLLELQKGVQADTSRRKVENVKNERTLLGGLTQAWNDYSDQVSNTGKNVGTAFTNIMGGLENTMVEFFDKGTIGWKQFGAMVRTELTKMYVKEQVMAPLMAGAKGLWASLFSANGNAFGPSGLLAFANGGVVNSPTMFGYGAGNIGIMGEAGPEAIVPLSRGTDGKLGVKSQGGAAPINVQVNVVNQSGTAVQQKGPAKVQWSNEMRDGIITVVVEAIDNNTGGLRTKLGG